MSVLSTIWEGVRTTLVGLRVTVPYIWRKPVTLRYPHEKMNLPERTRNRLYVNMDDCIGCDQCARACPVNCIAIETAKSVGDDSPGLTSNGKRKALWVTRFDIDIAKCCYCGLCTYPCPTECIKMTDVYEFSEQERNNLIYNYVTLTPEEIVEKIKLSEESERELAEQKKAAAAAPKAAAAPAAPATPAATPAAVANDPEKAAKLAELQAKMAAAKAAKEGTAAPAAAAPAAVPNGGTPNGGDADAEKAAKIAAMKAKIEAAKAASGAPASEPVAAVGDAAATVEAPAPEPAAAAVDEDSEKAARIAAMKAKIEEAKAKKEAGG